MSWLTEFVRPKIQKLVRRTDVPENLWHKCKSCEQMIFHRDLAKNNHVCQHCGHHMRISAKDRLETLFDGGTTDRLNVFGAINFENPGMVRSSLRFDFFNYSLATLAEAWHKPDYKVAFNNSFFPVEKLVVTADLYYLGGLNALNGETDEAYNLDDIFDLNLGARYDISQRFGVFLQFNNLFGKEYQRYLNYPTRGIQVLGGLSVSF